MSTHPYYWKVLQCLQLCFYTCSQLLHPQEFTVGAQCLKCRSCRTSLLNVLHWIPTPPSPPGACTLLSTQVWLSPIQYLNTMSSFKYATFMSSFSSFRQGGFCLCVLWLQEWKTSGHTSSLQLYWLFPFPEITFFFLLNGLVFLMSCYNVKIYKNLSLLIITLK